MRVTDRDVLAHALHEAGRQAVLAGNVLVEPARRIGFVEWADLPEHAKEGRRQQADYLLDHYFIYDQLANRGSIA